MKIRNKIWVSILIIILGYLFTLTYNYSSNNQIAQRLKASINQDLPATKFANENISYFSLESKSFEDGVLSGDEEDITLAKDYSNKIILNLDKSIKLLDSDSGKVVTKLKADLQEYTKKATTIYTLLANEEGSDDTQKQAKSLVTEKERLLKTFKDYADLQNEKLVGGLDKVISDKSEQLDFVILIFLTTLLVSFVLISLLIQKYISNPIKDATNFAIEVHQGRLSNRISLDSKDEIGELAVALNGMADELQSKADMAQVISSGDLTQQFSMASEKDVLGSSLQGMLTKLRDLVQQVTVAADNVSLQSGQISEFSHLLADGSGQQSAAIQDITSTMTQLGTMSAQTASNAKEASHLSQQGILSASVGTEHMEKMVEAMDEIQQSSQSMAKVIKNIDEIAFQTNMIALNAAVEAARAGQMGKGFAVVAEEVRSLAGRSADAAQQSTKMIEGSFEEVKAGQEISGETASALNEIVASYEQVSSRVTSISEASVEQDIGIVGVTKRLDQIDRVTQTNTSNAEEMAAAATGLSNDAIELQNLLAKFQLKKDSKQKKRMEGPKKTQPPALEAKPVSKVKVVKKSTPVPTATKPKSNILDKKAKQKEVKKPEKSNTEVKIKPPKKKTVTKVKKEEKATGSGWDKIEEQSGKGINLDLDSGDDYVIGPDDKTYIEEEDFGRF